MLRARNHPLNGYTVTGTFAMIAGSIVYFADQAQRGHSWHLFELPGLALASLGVLLAVVGTTPVDDES
jgi:hypothetical protein